MKSSSSLLASLGLVTASLLVSSISPARAAVYQVGDTVQDFTLYARTSFGTPNGGSFLPGDPVKLSDLAGTIVFLEFFYVW